MSDELNDELARLRARVTELERFERVVEALPLGLVLLSVPEEEPFSPRLVYANEKASAESRRELRREVGRSLREAFPSDYANGASPAYLPLMQRVASSGRAEIEEVDLAARGFVECHYVSIGSRTIAAVYQNVTTRKQAEASLQASEARFRQLADSMPQIVWTASSDGVLDYHNQRWFEYSGMSVEQTAVSGWSLVLHPDDREPCLASWRTAVGSGQPYEARCRFLRASDESYRWHLLRGVPVRGELGAITRWFGTSTDIDDSVRAESALRAAETALRVRESEERFRLLVSAIKDYAIFMLDPDGRVASWNPGAERIKGYTSDEIIGQHFSRFYPPEDVRGGRPDGNLRVAAEEGRCEDEGWRVRRDGSRFLASVVLSAVSDSAGALLGFAKVTRDVTERHRAGNALKIANRELESFSYSVAHDLRAPLRGMSGFAQLLLNAYQDQLDAEGQDWLQEILSNARKMGELIDALLLLARVTRSELRPERVDLSAVARAAASQAAQAEPERSVEVVIQESLYANVDPRLAHTILENLLGNARKFTQNVAAPRVEMGRMEVEDVPTFFVRDNGAGFDMAFASKLFTPFQRLHTVQEFPGTGIGLATVQRIIARHGGRIWAEGKVGSGATFFFSLPDL